MVTTQVKVTIAAKGNKVQLERMLTSFVSFMDRYQQVWKRELAELELIIPDISQFTKKD